MGMYVERILSDSRFLKCFNKKGRPCSVGFECKNFRGLFRDGNNLQVSDSLIMSSVVGEQCQLLLNTSRSYHKVEIANNLSIPSQSAPFFPE